MATSFGSSGALIVGQKAVTTAGTALQLDSTSPKRLVTSVAITAKVGNTGNVFIGGSDVASSTNAGYEPGTAIRMSNKPRGLDLSDIYIDVAVNGEGVDFIATI
mgnify:CR=1 FL=1|jgi:PPE-repeat protein